MSDPTVPPAIKLFKCQRRLGVPNLSPFCASPIRDFLRSQPRCLDYTNRMLERFFPELRATPAKDAVPPEVRSSATQIRTRSRSEDPSTTAAGTVSAAGRAGNEQ